MANIAVAHSLLELIYVMLKTNQPYRESDKGQIHAPEKAKLMRHHAKRLRQLGADEELVGQIVKQISQPETSADEMKLPGAPRPVRLRSAAARSDSGSPNPKTRIFS